MEKTAVSIETGCRLHFGPLSYRPRSGRHFGGVGLMVRAPGVHLTVTRHDTNQCDDVSHPRAAALLQRLRQQISVPPVRVCVASEIPPHAGLGSGTQLALALGDAVLSLLGDAVSVNQLAALTGRGDRSAIGIIGYTQGGLIVDAGHRGEASLGDLACRVEIPERWRFVLVIPPGAGLHGAEEQQVFQSLEPMSEQLTGRLCRLVLTEMLPALSSEDLGDFSRALGAYGDLVGQFFQARQGGTFSSASMQHLAEALQRRGISGAAQSSWGPAIAIPVADESAGNELAAWIKQSRDADDCRVEVTRGFNTGRQRRVM